MKLPRQVDPAALLSAIGTAVGILIALLLIYFWLTGRVTVPQRPQWSSLADSTHMATNRSDRCLGSPVSGPVVYANVCWYGRGFHGRPTASGEIFDQNAQTAASTRWPIGTRVLVTNPRNGRQTMIRINDRGPYLTTPLPAGEGARQGGRGLLRDSLGRPVPDTSRALDLSRAAFAAIEDTNVGVFRAALQVLWADSAGCRRVPGSDTSLTWSRSFKIQLGTRACTTKVYALRDLDLGLGMPRARFLRLIIRSNGPDTVRITSVRFATVREDPPAPEVPACWNGPV